MALTFAHRVSARRASLQDVNAIVRLLSGDHGLPPETAALVSASQAQLRLILAHFGLETGKVWVAESGSGAPEAAAVWIPPGVSIDEEEHRALLRLHGLRPTLMPARDHDGRIPGEEDHWLLAAVGIAPTAHPAALEVVLDPVLRIVDEASLPAYATAPASFQAELLAPFGFEPCASGEARPEPRLRRPPQGAYGG
ncbi:hypothetical protein ACFVYD_24175 [Streptomyces sp. NPDC058301]|uniref:hypothetical protein n=1 Tax=Streptomyces sp. NPDC058301 TaxID=3346436 RepID=UPI0036EC2339